MSAHKCNCGLPAPTTTICARCTYRLERDLAEIPALVDDLDITLSRQSAVTPHDGGKSAETPLAYNANASEARANLHGTLVGWVRDVRGEPIIVLGPRCTICDHASCLLIADREWPANETPTLARWLLSHLDGIRVHLAADQLHDEIGYAVTEARKAIDRPRNRSRVFVSRCLDPSCLGELWAYFPLADYDPDDPATHAMMTCTGCDVTYPAEQWLHVGRLLLRKPALRTAC